MGYAPTAADTIHAQTTWACSDCPILRERISYLEEAVERATQSAALASSKVKDLRVRLPSALVARTPPPVRHPTRGDLLVTWRNGSILDDRDGPAIQVIAASIMLRSSPPDIRLRHANGQEVVYARQITPCKPVVGRSQVYRRIAHGIRLLSNSVGGEASAAVVCGAGNISVPGPNCPGNRGSGALVAITAAPE